MQVNVDGHMSCVTITDRGLVIRAFGIKDYSLNTASRKKRQCPRREITDFVKVNNANK